MSTVRINLLPRDVAERERASRQRGGLIVVAIVFLLLLGLVYWWQLTQVSDAEDRLAQEEQVLAELNAELAELHEFEELEERVAQSDRLIALALSDEASFAGMLQDLAAVMPSDSQLETLSISLAEDEVPPSLGSDRPSFGTLVASGRTLNPHAPGVERLLLELEKIAGFRDLFFTSSTADEDGFGTFSVEAQLGHEILTRRYNDGLPEALR